MILKASKLDLLKNFFFFNWHMYTNPFTTSPILLPSPFSSFRARHSPWEQLLHWTAWLISPPFSPSHTRMCWVRSHPWFVAHASQCLLCCPYPVEYNIQVSKVCCNSSLWRKTPFTDEWCISIHCTTQDRNVCVNLNPKHLDHNGCCFHSVSNTGQPHCSVTDTLS